jgi:hypothetical protein
MLVLRVVAFDTNDAIGIYDLLNKYCGSQENQPDSPPVLDPARKKLLEREVRFLIKPAKTDRQVASDKPNSMVRMVQAGPPAPSE